MSTVRVALTQMACGEDADANLAKQVRLVEQAAAKGAKIICTQELFRSQYFCQVEDHRFFALAESIPGPSTEAFAKLAKKYKAVVVASLFEKRAAGVYHNTAAVIDADGSLLDFDHREVRASKCIMANSRQVFLVSDHSKFGRSAMVRLGNLGDLDAFFTDRTPAADICELLEKNDVRLHVAGEAATKA